MSLGVCTWQAVYKVEHFSDKQKRSPCCSQSPQGLEGAAPIWPGPCQLGLPTPAAAGLAAAPGRGLEPGWRWREEVPRRAMTSASQPLKDELFPTLSSLSSSSWGSSERWRLWGGQAACWVRRLRTDRTTGSRPDTVSARQGCPAALPLERAGCLPREGRQWERSIWSVLSGSGESGESSLPLLVLTCGLGEALWQEEVPCMFSAWSLARVIQ